MGLSSQMILSLLVLIIFVQLIAIFWLYRIKNRIKKACKENEEMYHMMFYKSPEAASITRLSDGVFVDVNDFFLKKYDFEREDVIGKSAVDYAWHNLAERERFVASLMEKGYCYDLEATLKQKDGSLTVVLLSAHLIYIEQVPYIYSMMRDISERKKTEAALCESEATYRAILHASPDGILITDLEGNLLIVSLGGKRMFGYEDDFSDFASMKFDDLLVPEDLDRARENLKKRIQTGDTFNAEYRAFRKDGTIFDIEITTAIIPDINREPSKFIIVGRDISARKQSEKQIQELVRKLKYEKNIQKKNALTDSLTGIGNRRKFDESIKSEIQRLKLSNLQMTLLLLDVDHFKKYNDLYGHVAGDECLKLLGEIFSNNVRRRTDFVARLGGEEFAILLPETDIIGGLRVAEKIRMEVESQNILHEDSDTKNHVTVSIGVAAVNVSEYTTPDEMLLLADEALYRAKEKGRNNVSL